MNRATSGPYLRGFSDPGERTSVSQGIALGALGARWSPDGSTIYYLSREREDVYTVMAAQTRNDVPLKVLPQAFTYDPDRNLDVDPGRRQRFSSPACSPDR